MPRIVKDKKRPNDEPSEKKLWKAADKLRKNMDAAEYKHIVLGLIFLKYISDVFEELYQKLKEGKDDYEAFFQAVKVRLVKFIGTGTGRDDIDIETAIKQKAELLAYYFFKSGDRIMAQNYSGITKGVWIRGKKNTKNNRKIRGYFVK